MLNTTTMSNRFVPPAQLHDTWRQWHTNEPNLRARDLAHCLGVSEGELVACRIGDAVMRLDGPWDDLIRELPKLGQVKVVTRNEGCRHEKVGTFGNIDLGPATGVVLNDTIDLRIFLRHWRHGYAVTEFSGGCKLDSLQFFDADGSAIHKIYRTDATDFSAWLRLSARFTAAVQTPLLEPRTVIDPLPQLLTDDAVDVAALRADWRAMLDGPHEFIDMLRSHRISRLQAMRLAGPDLANRVDNASIRLAFEQVRDSGLSIMVFTASQGVVQIHNGSVQSIEQSGGWLNVLDGGFKLRLRIDLVAEAWVVEKPCQSGPVRSLDLYDADGVQIVQLFGLRKPNMPQQPAWHKLLDGLPSREDVAV